MPVYLLLQVVYVATLLTACTYAVWAGGRSERIGASIMLIGSAASMLAEQLPTFYWPTARAPLVLIDLLVLAALYALALRSERFWPLWITAWHLIGVSMHALVYLTPPLAVRAYILLQGFWAYPMLLALLAGAWRTRHPPRARRGDARRAGGARVRHA